MVVRVLRRRKNVMAPSHFACRCCSVEANNRTREWSTVFTYVATKMWAPRSPKSSRDDFMTSSLRHFRSTCAAPISRHELRQSTTSSNFRRK